MLFSNLKYLILDVDGTLTDSGIYYDDNGSEIKKFSTRDAAGIFSLKKIGIKVIAITGRECEATKKRLEELQVDYIFQNVKNKFQFLSNYMKENNIKKEELGYIGDDLNDYKSMMLGTFIGCPKDACKEIIQIADCISDLNAGYGAVRDIVEKMLEKENLWKKCIKDIYGIGI